MASEKLTSPRKVLDVDAEIVSAAMLASPPLAAMVSTDPVRIAVCPQTGNGRTVNIGLPEASAVVLLARDVALVQSGDAVWAMLGIDHTPKSEQVARDARVICGRPGGASALALGWDGSATALTLGKNEVDARPFALRGAVRAAAMTEAETFVVVDASEGGELRIHPGATPESGANARATLPREARELDRLRAAQKLSVLFRPGERGVCVVIDRGGRLTARMVELEAPPSDVAVLEAGFVVISPDGRARLYDVEALGTEGGAADVASEVALGVRGEPRAMTATGRGSPSLWIGSSAGEIVTIGVARKSPV